MSKFVENYPEGTQLHKPDGSVYIYMQASEDISANSQVVVNQNKRLSVLRDRGTFPWGIVREDVKKEHYTFVMVRAPSKEIPAVG